VPDKGEKLQTVGGWPSNFPLQPDFHRSGLFSSIFLFPAAAVDIPAAK